MKGKSYSLRQALRTLAVFLLLGTLGSLSLARDAFDNDFVDCPQSTRLSALDGLAVERTNEEDEIRISWDALDFSELNDLGFNILKADLTVIVEADREQTVRHVALGEIDLVVDDVALTKDLSVSVALTQEGYVISDIAEAEFTSGMPAPSFMTDIMAKVVDVADEDGDGDTMELILDGEDYGDFYYLGFNNLFDNWFAARAEGTRSLAALSEQPASIKFRVGLRHGEEDLQLGDANFAHYRIVIEDSSGDELEYRARTVESKRTYSFVRSGIEYDRVIFFGEGSATYLTTTRPGVIVDGSPVPISNIRLSNRVDGGPREPYFTEARFGAFRPEDVGLTFGNTQDAESAAEADVLFALAPVEHYDFPRNVFEGDWNYIIKAWAEDENGKRISPQSSVELNIQRDHNVLNSRYQGYPVSLDGSNRRAWSSTNPGLTLAVWGLSIQYN